MYSKKLMIKKIVIPNDSKVFITNKEGSGAQSKKIIKTNDTAKEKVEKPKTSHLKILKFIDYSII